MRPTPSSTWALTSRAALGTILVGYLGQKIGWAYGFGLAGIGMVAGLIVFVLGKNVLLGAGEAPAPLAKSKEWSIYGVGLVAVGVMWALVQYQDVIQTLLVISGLGLLGWVLFQAFKLEKEPRERIFAILFLIALNPLFWGLFEQAGGSFNLYTDRYVDKGGVPASVFQSINPIYIILFAPVFAALWQWLGKRGLEPSAPGEIRAGARAGRGGLPRLRVGREQRRTRSRDARPLRLPALSSPHDRRAVPVAGGAERDESPRAVVHGVAHHGRLVLHDRGRQFRRRQDRGSDRRRKRAT